MRYALFFSFDYCGDTQKIYEAIVSLSKEDIVVLDKKLKISKEVKEICDKLEIKTEYGGESDKTICFYTDSAISFFEIA